MRRIAFISCTHVGSRVGLWPESWTIEDGQTIVASPVQKTIHEQFLNFWDQEAKDADTIILLGDLCQGKNHKEFGLGTMTPELPIQIEVAKALFAPHIKGRALLGVSGSRYHDSLDTSIDRSVIEGLGGRFLGMMQNITLKNLDFVINVSHGSSHPTIYKATHDDRESMLMSANSMTRNIDFVVRAHWHYYQYIENARRGVLRVPGWQCWYPAHFMVDILGKKNNKLGAVTVDFGPRKKIVVHKSLYEPPATWGVPMEI